MSTIKDVAQRTGLSIATISKYLNGGNVLDANRELIADAIEKLDYKVNLAARTLKTRRTMTIGILLPSLDTPFFTTICADIERRLMAEGYSAFLCSYYDDPVEERRKVQFLVDKNVDGIIMVPRNISADSLMGITQILERKTPIVLMDRSVDGFDRVLSDNTSAVHDAVEKLIICGHKRIGIIVGPQDVTTANERKVGYERVHADYALPLNPSLIRVGDYSISSGYREMSLLLDMENPPTAVMGTNHEMTMGAIAAAYERKLKIPDDISFIGYDEVQLTKAFNPPITIVLQPIEEIARHTTEILIRRMSGDYGSFPQVQRLKSRLLMHDSIRNIG